MNDIKLIQIKETDVRFSTILVKLFGEYFAEISSHLCETPPNKSDIIMYIDSLIKKQANPNRYLVLFYLGIQIIGFCYCKIDRPGDKGYIKPGYLYIMEYYIKPEYRRKKYGTRMFEHIESKHKKLGVSKCYLTSDSVTGFPFWTAQGFYYKGEISTDNNQRILEKEI